MLRQKFIHHSHTVVLTKLSIQQH